MTKYVWTIEQGEYKYSDYGIVGIYSSQEIAESELKLMKESEGYRFYEPYIVKRALDSGVNERRQGRSYYRVQMGYRGNILKCDLDVDNVGDETYGLSVWRRTQAPAWMGLVIDDVVSGGVWAKDEKHAIKIANEFRIQAIANNEMTIREEVDL